ncbi:MAG: hypothetical protein AWM53_01390 [Candidatus Dichloromethanomonas elyunquensis]|nr:MAG: hypothetical protein AWM53_01390 [Candidatus Dichloromethanomonas elyunquensis]
MYRTLREKCSIWVLSVFVLGFMFILSGLVSGQVSLLGENNKGTPGNSEINMETLEKLFTQVQKIEGMQNEQKQLSEDLESLKKEIEVIQKSMADEQIVYSRNKGSLKQFLQTYQKMGPGSYLEIVLESDDLADFLRRISILRDITGNTGELLAQLQNSRNKQSAETVRLSQKFRQIQDKQQGLKDALANEIRFKSELENDLAVLAGEKGNYQESLAEMKQSWNELKPFITETVKEFSRILEEGNIPPGTLKLTASFFSMTGTMSDESLNAIVAGDRRLPQIIFTFHPGEAEVNIPEKHLVLNGTFVIQEGHILQYQAQRGSYYGLPLEKSSIEELFRENDMRIECRSVLGRYALNSVEIGDGYLRFSVVPG